MRCPNISYSYISPTNLAAAKKNGTIVEIRGDPSDFGCIFKPMQEFFSPTQLGTEVVLLFVMLLMILCAPRNKVFCLLQS